MKKFFKQFFIGVQVLSIASILFFACSKKDDVTPSLAEPTIDYAKTEKYLAGAINEVEKYKESNPYDLEKITDVINTYAVKETGGTAIQYEEINNLFQKYQKYSKDETIQPLLNTLVKDGLLSSHQSNLLQELDENMLRINSIPEALQQLDVFEQKVVNTPNLNGIEKFSLKLMKSCIKVQYEHLQSQGYSENSRSACTDCLLKNKWGIFRWAAVVVVVGLIACILATGGFGAPICIAAVAAGWATEIGIHCPMCFGL
jgi:hypothetical protein